MDGVTTHLPRTASPRATAATEGATKTGVPSPTLDEGDHDRFAHYVIGGNEAIINSMVTGDPVTALCGKVWVPSRDPERYPVCPLCEEVKAALGR